MMQATAMQSCRHHLSRRPTTVSGIRGLIPSVTLDRLQRKLQRPRLPPPRFGKTITVLSIDGGGIRGLIPAVVLESLEKKLQRIDKDDNARIADYFDVIAGTSTGGLIATMLVTPDEYGRPKFTPKKIKEFYFKNGPDIFPRSHWPGLLGKAGDIIRALRGPRYDGKFLCKQIVEVTGKHTTLADTITNLVVPTFDVCRLQPVIFSSFEAHLTSPDKIKIEKKPLLSDVCIGTSAAPTYFPAHFFKAYRPDGKTIRSVFHLIDGGVVANNPTMAAITRVAREQLLGNEDFGPDGVDYKKYLVISIGTGSVVTEKGAYTAQGCAKWGAISWLLKGKHTPLIDMLSHGSAFLVDLQVRMLLHNTKKTNQEQNYLRIQALSSLFKDPVLSMDEATEDNMKKLEAIGGKVLGEKMASVDLYMGRYLNAETDLNMGRYQPKVPETTNDQELERFAESLVAERKLRIEAQDDEK